MRNCFCAPLLVLRSITCYLRKLDLATFVCLGLAKNLEFYIVFALLGRKYVCGGVLRSLSMDYYEAKNFVWLGICEIIFLRGGEHYVRQHRASVEVMLL